MKKVLIRYILPVLGVIAVVLLDQWTKYLTVTQIGEHGRVVLIDGIFELVYVKNYGMAWGLFQNKQWLFIIMTPIVLGAVIWQYVKMPFEKRFIEFRIMEVMIAGGAIGNLLDRMFRGEFGQGHVVDMFYVSAINFPVFNVADSFISVGFVLMVVYTIFKYTDEDFERMFPFWKAGKTVKTVETDNTEDKTEREVTEASGAEEK